MAKAITKEQLGSCLDRISDCFADTKKSFTGANASTAGAGGMVPAPLAGEQEKFLRADGTWALPDGSGGAGIEIGDVTNASISANHARVMLTWTDPENLVIEGATLARWAGTLVVRKVGSAPANKSDGTLVVDSKSRNAYASTPFVDSGLTDGITYYYRFFPYTTGSTYTTGTVLDATPDRTAVAIPTIDSALTYDGTYQTPTFTNYDSTKMTKSGDEGATNAGNYSTTFTLDDDYKWSDDSIAPKTVAWSIAKAAGAITLSKNSISLDATTTSDTVTVSRLGDGAISVESSDTSVVTASISGDTVTITEVGEGSATITVSVADGTNYLAATKDISAKVAFFPAPGRTLNEYTWDEISQIAQAGVGEDYFDVGDCKEITLNGKIGDYLTLSNQKLCVFILDFNHPDNGVADNNIIFGGFKTALSGGTDVALCDSKYNTSSMDGSICFNMSHKTTATSGDAQYGYNYGGWKGSDLRYDILGATSTAPSQYNVDKNTSNVGYDATATTLTSPKADTFLAALPSDLRNVLRLRTHYVDNKGNKSNVNANVTAVTDAVSLLAEYEVLGSRSYANQYEKNHQTRMKYYANGNSAKKYKHSNTSTAVFWWECSPYYNTSNAFCFVDTNGGANFYNARYSYALAPALKI